MKNLLTSINPTLTETSSTANSASGGLISRLLKSSLALCGTMAITASVALGQVAPVNPPLNGFDIDGDLKSNMPTINRGDWVEGVAGTGGHVFSNAGVSLHGSAAARVQDPYNSNDIIFTQGSKFNGDPNGWAWSTGSAPDKNDIHNSLYLVTKDGSNNDWLVIGGDRLSTNGTSYIDFELLQDDLSRTNNGGFTTPGPHGGRRINDLVISMEYSNGGSKPRVIIYRWVETSPGRYSYVILPMTTPVNAGTLADYVFAETNRSAAVDVPYGAFGNNSYQRFAFVEAAVNMTKVIGSLGDPCLGLTIKTVFIKTKASDSFTAALKDMVEPQAVSITFGSASISYGGPYCATGTASVTMGSGSVTGGTFSASPSGLSINSSTGEIDLANSSANSYTVTYTYTTNGCQKTATAQVVVNGIPNVTASNSGPLCEGATLNLSSTPSSGTYSWIGPDNFTSSSQNPTISNITAAKAGTYTVYVTLNGCTASNTTTVAINSVAGTPVLSVINPSCSRILGEITVTSPDPASGLYEYTNDNWTTSNTTGVFTFAAGQGYSIKARAINGSLCESLANECTGDPNYQQAREVTSPADPLMDAADEADLTVYPNPFSMNSTLEFKLLKDGRAELAVYDMSGRLVKKVFSANAEAGITYRTGLDGSSYGDGAYIARLTVDGKVLRSIRIIHQK